MSEDHVTASIVIIGDEILSGRTHDQNTHWLTGQLTEMGINTQEVRVVPDDKARIIEAVKACAARYDYVFTTGGIGPTHDDITAESIAECFGVALELNPTAHQLLKDHYGDDLNEARLKMAYIPAGATLIENPISSAPAFVIENVYIMAGIPPIMQAMFESIKPQLKGGIPTLSRTITGAVTEGMIAAKLTEIQQQHQEVSIGSYPFIKGNKLGVSIVVRGTDNAQINACAKEVTALIKEKGKLLEDITQDENI